jgi:glucuronate isomerase
MLADDRYFDPNPTHKKLAMGLYELVRDAPIISPHGHVDPGLFSQKDYHFPNPAALLFQSDHYVLRMLYSQGIPYDILLSKDEPYRAWETFAENFYLFRGTPSGMWITHELEMVFGITEKLNKNSAKSIYDKINNLLSSQEFTPRNLFKQFNIEVLATTDSAAEPLAHHQALRSSGWNGRIIPTFRADDLLNITSERWVEKIHQLSELTNDTIDNYYQFIQALEDRRSAFKALGARAVDIGITIPRAIRLSTTEVERLFKNALRGEANKSEEFQFCAHMLYEMARMSSEDGLVMQIHPGVYRNHNPQVNDQYGPDMGFDIPISVEFTRNLHQMLADFGNHPNFNLILFTLAESTYSQELAPLAGAYPSVKLGPPWWFLDSWIGMARYFKTVMETAGIYNTAGFNDDTRAFLSIPARHDLWRRASANWLAGLLIRDMIDEEDSEEMIHALAIGLAKSAYKL